MSLSSQPAAFADFKPHRHFDDEVCPTCEQVIPNDRIEQVKVRQAERQQALEDQYTAKSKLEREQLVTQLRQEHRQEKDEALTKVRQEGEAAATAARADERRAATAEMEAKVSTANAALLTASAQAEELRKQLEASSAATAEKVSAAKVAAMKETEALLQPQLVAAQAAAQEARDAASALAAKEQASRSQIAQLTLDVTAAREDGRKAAEAAHQLQLTTLSEEKQAALTAKAAAEQQMKAALEGQEKVVSERVQETRDALEKSHRETINAEQAKHFTETQKIQNTVEDLRRQLEKKTAQELGEGAEVDLFEALKNEFPSDNIWRVAKGVAGADIHHRVRHNGKDCGLILYDSKNHQAWRNDFVTKLRDDQISAQADYAILSTTAFPQGTKQVHVDNSVILANPARAVTIAKLIRQVVVQVHCLNLSNEDREEKTLELYGYITSERFTTVMTKLHVTTDSLTELDVREKAQHNTIWQRRGQLIGSVAKAQGDIQAEIDRIVGTACDLDEVGAVADVNSVGGSES